MSRCNTIIAAALAAAALAAPTALAQPPDIHAGLRESAAPAQERHSGAFRAEIPDPVQDLRSPDTRDAARATTPSDRPAARPDTAGNPTVSAGAARSKRANDHSNKAAPGDHLAAALAQERYYSSYGKPAPLTTAAPAVAPNIGDGIARLPFVIAVLGALVVGLGAGSGLHLLHVRRRHASGLAT